MKKCPFCSEEIQNSAKKCRHCGEWLNESENQVNQSNSEDYFSLAGEIQPELNEEIEHEPKKRTGISENDLEKTRLFGWFWKIWGYGLLIFVYSMNHHSQATLSDSGIGDGALLIGIFATGMIWTVLVFIAWKLIIYFWYGKIVYEKKGEVIDGAIRLFNKAAYFSMALLICLVGYIGYSHYKNIDAWYSLLQKQASTTNASLPKMIDSDTRLDEQVVLKPANIQYKYTLVNTKKGDIDAESVKEKLSTAIMTSLPTTYDKGLLNTLVKIGANISFLYYDKEGNILFQIDITNKQLSDISKS